MGKHVAVALTAAAALVALTGCGSGSGGTTTGSTGGGSAASGANGGAVTTIHEGKLTVGSALPFAPMEFYEADGKTMTGIDIDLIREVAKRMNLEADIQNTDWDGLIPAAKANRYDVVVASIGDFIERQPQLDFVDYLTVQAAVVVKAADKDKIKSSTDLCGKTAGATRGAATVTALEQFSKECTDAGKPAITINQFSSTAEGITALEAGRIDAENTDGPVAVYTAKTKPGLALGFTGVGVKLLYGLGVSKTNTALRDGMQKAMQAMMDDGTYKKLLDKYGLAEYAIDKATVNAGGHKAK